MLGWSEERSNDRMKKGEETVTLRCGERKKDDNVRVIGWLE